MNIWLQRRMAKFTAGLILVGWIAPAKLPAADKTTAPRPFSDPALRNQWLGLFAAENFRLTTGVCNDCPTPKQALWYFQNDLIAVPKQGLPVAGLASRFGGYQNLLHALPEPEAQTPLAHPSLIWIGSPEMINQATLSSDGMRITTPGGEEFALSLVSKISSNRSYYDLTSTQFFRQRALRLRGARHIEKGQKLFVARTIWPEDFRVDTGTLTLNPLPGNEQLADLIIAEKDAAIAPFQARLLWEHNSGRDRNWAGRPMLGLLLSGGQGDDDESQAGHLAVVTGRFGASGEMADWMVNNFYNLDEESEKGIIASMLPMDNYLMDLNSGQSYYRPVYLLIAVLKEERAARRFQAAIQPLYNHFYRHDFLYHHSRVNCTGISVDTLRALGWQIPTKGPTGYAKALAAFLYLTVTEASFASGAKTFDYLTEEQTRLFPRAAFETAAQDLLALVGEQKKAPTRQWTDYERALRDDMIAVLFIRIAQIPSSRAIGTYPVASFDEYKNRVPADRSQWKTVSVNARPFPDSLKETLPDEPRMADLLSMTTVTVLLAVFAVFAIWLRHWRRRA